MDWAHFLLVVAGASWSILMGTQRGVSVSDTYLRGWKRVGKDARIVPQTTQVVNTLTVADVATTGTKLVFKPAQAFRILRYTSGIASGAGNPRAEILISPGVIMIQISPFGPSNSVGDYADPYIPAQPSANIAGSGSFPGNVGTTMMLLDDWIEYDDYLSITGGSLTIQLQTQWTVRNSSGANDTMLVGPEYLLFETWERSFLRKI